MWEEFPPVSSEEWEAAIRADLKGADYSKKLVWQTEEGIGVKPYYRRGDLPGSTGQARFTGEWKVRTVAEIPADAVRGDSLHEEGATSVQEVAYAMADWKERGEVRQSPPKRERAAHREAEDNAAVHFVFAVGGNYFMEIAKLRAARQVWAQISDAPMVIWARTSLLNKSLYDPSANLMRCTTEAMSAIFGGCDYLVVEAAQFGEHLAESLPRILAEESHFDRVSDPAGGSYYVEVLTASIAAEARKVYEAEHDGVRRAGEIGVSRAAKQKAVRLRKRTLVGVNNYPDLTETLPADAHLPKSSRRLAEDFEGIRREVEKLKKRPVVLLLQRGDLKMRMARANFAQNFFGCGGFAVRNSDKVEPADLIVLCSSDSEYLALAKEIIPKTRVPVIVAGNPREDRAALKEAGVRDFVYLGVDAVEVLLDQLEALR